MEGEHIGRKTVKDCATPTSQADTSESCLKPSELVYKSYFFLFFIAIGSSIPYLALYFKQLGLTAGQAGAVLGLRLFTECIGSPLWGIVGDKYKIRKAILMASLVSFTTGNLLLLAVQPLRQTCIETGPNKTVIKPLIFTPKGIILGQEEMGLFQGEEVNGNDSSDLLLNRNFTTGFTRKVDEQELVKIFMILLSIIFLSQIVGSVVFSMPDALVVAFLRENVNKFGTFRMWGEVGIAAGSFLVGGVISLYKSEVCGEIVKNYNISFYCFAGFIALAMINVLFLEVKYPDHESSHTPHITRVIFELIRGRNSIFIALACYFGVLNGMQEHFGLWYLDDLGARPYMVGIAAGLRNCVALLGYVSSRACIEKIGLVSTLASCLLLNIAVALGLAFVLNPWLGVALHSIQGLLHGLGWSACVVFGGTVSLQVGSYAAVQGVIGGCHWGLGLGIGVTVSGLIINAVGVPKTYFIYAMTSVAMLVCVLFFDWLTRSQERKQNADETSYKLVPQNTEDGDK